VKKLLANDPEMFKREQLGVITKNSNNCFPIKKVVEFEQTSKSYTGHVDVLFCAIDPAGGGSSCAAICTGFLFNNRSELMVRA
jgi:hypothetical protein